MKVTVCFGAVRIVVPCGNGEMLVKDLIREATRRYKKATAKEPDAWVAVHHLQTQSGILDPDDCIGDVADDREQILVSFEDSGPDPGVPQGGGDGASGSSSVGTGSPDIFRDPTNTEAPTTGHQQHKRHATDVSAPHIEVTSTTTCPVTGLGLQVRRSSDPNLLASLKAEGSGNKRWSAAAPHCAGDSPERVLLDKQHANYLSPQWEEDDESAQQQRKNQTVSPSQQQQQPFARSGRLSMQFLNDGNGYKWMEAAEKLQQQQQQPHSSSPTYSTAFSTKSLPRESKRKEPLGQAYESIREKDGEMLLIINEKGSPLGLTAIPDNEHGGGLLVQHVEPNGRADRGRLRRGDRILEINGTKLIGLTEGKVQEYLHRALEATELRVRVLRAERKSASGNVGNKARRRDSKVAEMIEAEEKQASTMESKVATVSPTRKSHHIAAVGNSLQMANTRKLGHKIEIALRKGANGLGFSVTTRDNQASRDCPIYIKNILPRGAAIEDGRLKPGDRLLEVDGIPMTGKTQTDVVSILRATQPGATVQLVVSRQQELVEKNEENEQIMSSPVKPPPPVLPKSSEKQQQQQPQMNRVVKSSSARSLFEQHKNQQQQQQPQLNASQHFIDAGSESAASTDSIQAGIAWRSREVLTLHIPVHDTEKAGLGVSVKGKTSSTSLNNTANSMANASNNSIKHDGDLGIFVKNVIHGGAASRDGRLRMNDQLLSVNGVSLLGQNNAEAMETLRRAMVNQPGKHPGMITLTVARRITRSASSGDIIEQSNDSSNTSDNSGATVIYLTPEKKDLRSVTDSGPNNAANDMQRWSNPVLDRLTGGACSQNSSARTFTSHEANKMAANMQNAHAGLRNDSYYLATHDTWSPGVHTPVNRMQNGHVLIEDDAEPLSPLLTQQMANDSVNTQNSKHSVSGSAPNFDATYSSQLSLETNNSGVEHFSRDALGRRSISEKHHAALDARETGTYQRNKKLREERERERRIQLTKSAFFGSVESLNTRIANANAQIPGYKHAKTASSIEQQKQLDLQGEARDVVTDLGPSLGLKKSSSLESLQTMVQEIQMSDEPRGAPSALRAPRGRGREDSLRAAVVGEPDINKPRKHWLLEEHTDGDAGFTQRNGPFQSSLNDGKNKARAKKPSILRGIGHMFRFGKNRKETVVPTDATSTTTTTSATMPANTSSSASTLSSSHTKSIPVAALAAMERTTKLLPPAYQPPPPLPPQPKSHNNSNISNNSSNNNGIHQSDVFNQRYQHYANYEDLHPGVQQHNTQAQQQIRAQSESAKHEAIIDENANTSTNSNAQRSISDVLSESTLECMRQQVIRQRVKVEAESRRHQHYHSQRSTRSQDVNFSMNSATIFNNNNNNNKHHNNNNNNHINNKAIRPNSSYYEYETVQHNVLSGLPHARMGSIKHNGHSPLSQHSRHTPSPVTQSRWKSATMNGFSPASLNSSARSRGPYVTHVTIREQQPVYQSVQQPQSHSSKV